MLNSIILTLFIFLIPTLALNVTRTKTFFFERLDNMFLPQMFHTKNGILAYSVEQTGVDYAPQYLQINLKARTPTLILSDIMTSCGHSKSNFNKLHYHAPTFTLVYYCTNNNTLLILNEEDYTVKDTIPVYINKIFQETKLSTDGKFLVIIGMGELFLQNPPPSYLIRINIGNKKIVNQIIFNEELREGEMVAEFASKDSDSYILTNKIDGSNTEVTIYSLILDESSYQLEYLSRFNYTSFVNQAIASLYCFGDYIVTNDLYNLIFFSKSGDIIYNMSGLFSKLLRFNPTWITYPTYAMQAEASELYALINHTIVQISVTNNATLTTKEIARAPDMQVALRSSHSYDLLFYIDLEQDYSFNILDTQTSRLVYATIIDYKALMITQSTYSAYNGRFLYIFDLQTDILMANFTVFESHYHDQKHNAFYYIELTSNGCDLVYVDLETTYAETIYQINDQVFCYGSISQLKASKYDSPELVISQSDRSFLIITEKFGQVTFIPPAESVDMRLVIPNYEKMSLFYLTTVTQVETTNVSSYSYDYSNKKFIFEGSYSLNNIPVLFYTGYFPIDSERIILMSAGIFTFIDLKFGTAAKYALTNDQMTSLSVLQDNSQIGYLIISGEASWIQLPNTPTLFGFSSLNQLPGTNNLTVEAGSAGFCSYFVTDGLRMSIGTVSFYNSCKKERFSMDMIAK